jgi:uncharacterized protein YprB with RNaseH-like and TPR domain
VDAVLTALQHAEVPATQWDCYHPTRRIAGGGLNKCKLDVVWTIIEYNIDQNDGCFVLAQYLALLGFVR